MPNNPRIVTLNTRPPAYSLAYLLYLFGLAQRLQPDLTAEQVTVSAQEGGGWQLEFFVSEPELGA